MSEIITLEDFLKKKHRKNLQTIEDSGSLEEFLNSFADNLGAGSPFVPDNELKNGACLYSSIGRSLRCFEGLPEVDELAEFEAQEKDDADRIAERHGITVEEYYAANQKTFEEADARQKYENNHEDYKNVLQPWASNKENQAIMGAILILPESIPPIKGNARAYRIQHAKNLVEEVLNPPKGTPYNAPNLKPDDEPAQSIMNTLKNHLAKISYDELMKSMGEIANDKNYNYAARIQAAHVYKKKDIVADGINEGSNWYARLQFLTNWDSINNSGLAPENYPEMDILLLYAWFEKINIGLINVSGSNTIDAMAQKFYFGGNNTPLNCFLLFEGGHFKHICPDPDYDPTKITVPKISDEEVNMANEHVNDYLKMSYEAPAFRTDVELFWYLYKKEKTGFEDLIEQKNMSDVLFVYARNMESLKGSGSAKVASTTNAELQTFGITTGTVPGREGRFKKLKQNVDESLLEKGLETRYPKEKYPSLHERVDNRKKNPTKTDPISAENVINSDFEDLSKWIQDHKQLKRVYFPGTKTGEADEVEWGTSIYKLDEPIIKLLTGKVNNIARRLKRDVKVVDKGKSKKAPKTPKLEDVGKKKVETREEYAEYLDNLYSIFQSMKITAIYDHFQKSGV